MDDFELEFWQSGYNKLLQRKERRGEENQRPLSQWHFAVSVLVILQGNTVIIGRLINIVVSNNSISVRFSILGSTGNFFKERTIGVPFEFQIKISP